MNPDTTLTIADHVTQQLTAPTGVLWILVVVIVLILGVLLVLGRWTFSQAAKFSEYLQTTNANLVQTVANNTTALEACIEESKCTRDLMRRIEDELKRGDRRV
jgi:hypothetical protein